MELFIDTTMQGLIRLGLYNEKKIVRKMEKRTTKISESLLVEIEIFLKRNKISLEDVESVLVNPGPGAFSATRTGVATANALTFALGIPLMLWPSRKAVKIALPEYDREPNITKPHVSN